MSGPPPRHIYHFYSKQSKAKRFGIHVEKMHAWQDHTVFTAL
jgi:hypothetical protein